MEQPVIYDSYYFKCAGRKSSMKKYPSRSIWLPKQGVLGKGLLIRSDGCIRSSIKPLESTAVMEAKLKRFPKLGDDGEWEDDEIQSKEAIEEAESKVYEEFEVTEGIKSALLDIEKLNVREVQLEAELKQLKMERRQLAKGIFK